MTKFFTMQKMRHELSEINMIPLVDVVFNLLIIFMIMAPIIYKGLEVRVPESSVGEALPERDHHVVTITKEAELWFDKQKTSLEELGGYLQEMSAEDTIYIQSDKEIPYGYVVDVITAIKEHGIRNVGLVTNPVVKDKK